MFSTIMNSYNRSRSFPRAPRREKDPRSGAYRLWKTAPEVKKLSDEDSNNDKHQHATHVDLETIASKLRKFIG